MEKKQTILLAFLLILFIVSNASGLTVSFTDRSFLQKNNIIISDHQGILIANVSGQTPVSLTEGRSYFITYDPVGSFDLAEETAGSFTWLDRIILFGKTYLPGLIVLIVVVVLLTMRRK